MPLDSNAQILEQFSALLTAKGLSLEQQKKVVAELDEAIVLNVIGRLHIQLTTSQKEELAFRKLEKAEDLLEFFKDKVPTAQIQESLKRATETMVGKFLEKI